MAPDVRTLSARWVFPAFGPPLENGTVTIRGDTIEAVEPRGLRTADEHLGNVAIIPGLVNAHTHLDLSGARGLIPPTDPDHFTDWLKGVIAYRRTRNEEQMLADIDAGLAECLRYGTTLIGDIAAGGLSWRAVTQSAMRAVLFWELIGLSAERYQASWEEYATKTGQGWVDDLPPGTWQSTPHCRWAISPHAPYSVNHGFARGQLALGQAAIHLAESPGEMELLATRTGPFVAFLQELGVWNPDALTAGVHDFFATDLRTKPPVLYVHCNYLPLNAPLAPVHSIVYCPRTHAAFGHPPHPFREFLARGVRVCLGTDSLASNPDLDILAEARFVHSKYPDFPGDVLLKMITLSGAEALGWADECGSLEPGKSADLVAVPLPDTEGEPHELLFSPSPGERRTMWRGEWR